MAEIRITIPDDKIGLIVKAVEYHTLRDGEEPKEITPIVAKDWLKQRLIKNIKGLVKSYQREKYENDFVFDDPLE